MKQKTYFWYLRKSTDVEDKQVSSLEDQEKFVKLKAEYYWVKIIKIFSESQSAKAPWRAEFNKMVQALERWEADWIISWKMDRISRNPIDSGTIQYMLQTWKLHQLITNDREYNPVDAWLLMSVESGMSNQYIMDLRNNVKRWMDWKVEKGVFCGKAPEGYINNRLDKTVEIDIGRFEIVRKIWDLMLTWDFSVPKLTKVVKDDLWFRRKKRARTWWNPIAVSWMYKLLTNPFYMGHFNWNWEVLKGTHTPMVTYDEFNRVQKLLGRSGRTVNARTHHFAYTGFIKCGECWASITATESNKKGKMYTYYHCTKSSKDIKCQQKKYLSVNRLEENIIDIIDSISISREYYDEAVNKLEQETQVDIEANKIIKNNMRRNLKKLKSDLDRLLKLCVNGTITEADYLSNKDRVEKEIVLVEDKLNNFWEELESSLKLTERYIDFLSKVKEAFVNGWLEKKKRILRC